LLLLKNNKEVNEFLTDLCTPSELKALNERWSVAQTLNKNELSYREIADKLKTSTTTVTRVARFLSSEQNDGYKTILKRIK
jgi:TrpR-related protein YerC/YecD